jgi:single-stranded-DNA-specific exonuclease
MPSPSRWALTPVSGADAARLAAALGVGLPAASVLCARGFSDPDRARAFLSPSLHDLHDPFLMLGMGEAVARLRQAIAAGERILIYGDYDVDGSTAIVILKKAIEMAGGLVSHFIPHRLRDGYGLHGEAIERAAHDGVRLIVSVDTGIRAAEAVRLARSLGMDVIVTDHHLPEAELPPAAAILNPNRPGCGYPEKNLCGAGVAFKLIQALLASCGWPRERIERVTASFLKLVAIATVADVVPLIGENRVIVKHGLSGLAAVRNPGLRALLEVAGFPPPAAPTATQVAFRVAPRINAAGRMDSAMHVIEMFTTPDAERARSLAQLLHDLNAGRQQTETEIVEAVLEECARAPITDRQAALVFCGDNWHRGVLGIVASRLLERFHRPIVVLSAENGLAQGSGRSIAQFHLLDALDAMPELFIKYGGHSHAAGLTLAAGDVPRFRERFNEYAAARLTAADFVAERRIDAPLSLADLNDRAVAEVLAIGPFGNGNPDPVFAVYAAQIAGPPAVWKDKHLRFAVRQNGRTMMVKAWGFAGRIQEFEPGACVDLALSVEQDSFSAAQGLPGWSLSLRDVRPAQATGVNAARA